MVGLVVVSHSRRLADAAVALASEMLHGAPVRIAVAAGLDDDTFGTDAVAIGGALTEADDGDGVVVLMDLGSAVLSTELALELLDDDEARSRVLLCAAPLVEGLVAAAVAAAGGASREEVAAEASGALAGKQTHLGETQDQEQTPPGTPSAASVTARFTVTNPHGLHARPAARLVSEARSAPAPIEIRNLTADSPWVSATSLSRVATIGALQGHELEIRAGGDDARAALDRITALAARAFDEPTSAGPPSPAPSATYSPNSAGDAGPVGSLAGQAASPGVGIGPVWHLHAEAPAIPDVPSQGAEAERARLAGALADVERDIGRIRRTTHGDAAAVFDAHLQLLDDPDLLDDARARIHDGSPAPQAWAAAADRVAGEFEALADPYLQARAEDVRAVAVQVLRALLGVATTAPAGDGVLVAGELTPAEAAGLDAATCVGVVLASGSPSSHAAIIARTRGMPLVVGAGPPVLRVPEGTTIALDGGTGDVVVDPPEGTLADFRGRAGELTARRQRAAGRGADAARTRDGVGIQVGANVGSVADAQAAAGHGADLAGLVRTEFLFLGRDTAPGADEQEATYRRIAEALGGRRITLRTLDVGGDKPLSYLPGPREENPFLGVRGLRHSLAHPALLAEQLQAIVRVARDVPVSVMFPMVSTVPEVVRARELLDEAIARAGGGPPAGLEVGIMVEVPAAALKTAAFVPYVDFVSIGTNDLTQYALAAERGNADLGSLADGLDPGVLRLIDAVGRGAAGRITVAVCGELAADETAVPLLIGLGVRELSVA
ncbi:phosphoenolpyruvate--protein phosphotransferase, partial [Actinoplanes sp. NPDC051633]|uniref:phosphoenolpyruvate--protein phosphotransferase n=1 Tax=Actinoplanes sp. NPDC051633 TaxID=3155670 RepID=UPI003431E052